MEPTTGNQRRPLVIGVIGSRACDAATAAVAEAVGSAIARAGAVLVCGGLGGVMEAACRGAARAGGLTVGILPGDDAREANPWVRVPVVTGMGVARNVIVVRTAAALVAVAGGPGTLSEIAFALQLGVPVVGIDTWDVADGVVRSRDAESAVAQALRLARRRA